MDYPNVVSSFPQILHPISGLLVKDDILSLCVKRDNLMTRSEAGKLGWLVSSKIHTKNKEIRISNYLLNPSTCVFCQSILGYENRNLKFCNQSCAAKENNKRRSVQHFCKFCKKPLSRDQGKQEFCSRKCHFEHEQKKRIDNWLVTGKIGRSALRRHLLSIYCGKCSCCNLGEWMGKRLVLELEHKDGNSSNDSLENVCLLCPNCHSQTNTYKGKNIGKGRHSRRIRYREGKSY